MSEVHIVLFLLHLRGTYRTFNYISEVHIVLFLLHLRGTYSTFYYISEVLIVLFTTSQSYLLYFQILTTVLKSSGLTEYIYLS